MSNNQSLQESTAFHQSIGVVIPIYNVAPYLRECLDSVINQTYKNLHVVLVNDGSTDGSLEIAKEYVLKDSRFVLLDKENGGLSEARNTGIDYFANKLDLHIGGGANTLF